MSVKEQRDDYWVRYWTNNSMFDQENPQAQVARTVLKVPIDDQQWQLQLAEIERKLDPGSDDTLLDLCAGNGLIAKPFSRKCRSVTAVDVSRTLLERIDPVAYPNIVVTIGDIREVSLPAAEFSKGVMYTSLQYFSEREAIGIFETIRNAMSAGGIFLIGDIPDVDRIFDFYNKPEWVAAYFDSLKGSKPAMGTWFKKDILCEMAKYVGFSRVVALAQPPHLITSHYRFDLLLTK
jgi:cyclopropane fatty-acyl-phospholipid synthase-like methyltransferase